MNFFLLFLFVIVCVWKSFYCIWFWYSLYFYCIYIELNDVCICFLWWDNIQIMIGFRIWLIKLHAYIVFCELNELLRHSMCGLSIWLGQFSCTFLFIIRMISTFSVCVSSILSRILTYITSSAILHLSSVTR